MNYRICTILSGGIALILYLSLRPSPKMAELSWLPPWLAQWTDQNGELRTAVPFLADLLQIPLAHRYFIWGDIGWGIIGDLGGCAPVFVRGLFLKAKRTSSGAQGGS